VQPLTNHATPNKTARRPMLRAPATARGAPCIAALALVVALSLVVRTAVAAAPNVPDETELGAVVELTTLSPCFDRASLTDAIERWLDRSTVDARLRIRVASVDGAPSFSIQLGSEAPLVRRFESGGTDCDAERDALALSIALAIDALSSKSVTEHDPTLNLGLDGLVTTPWPNRVALGAALRFGLRASRHFAPEVDVSLVETGSQSVPQASTASFAVRLIMARVSGCYLQSPIKRVDVGGCGGLALGPATVSASGLTDSRSETQWYLAADLSFYVRFRVTRGFAIRAGADILASLRRGTLQVEGDGGQPLFAERLPFLSGVFRLGPEASF
jgi:hypothetical protein